MLMLSGSENHVEIVADSPVDTFTRPGRTVTDLSAEDMAHPANVSYSDSWRGAPQCTSDTHEIDVTLRQTCYSPHPSGAVS